MLYICISLSACGCISISVCVWAEIQISVFMHSYTDKYTHTYILGVCPGLKIHILNKSKSQKRQENYLGLFKDSMEVKKQQRSFNC